MSFYRISFAKLCLLIFALIGVLYLGITLIHPAQSQALSGSDFNAGRIIDDEIFYNKDAMTTAQIQSFLNAKLPTCDTNGDKLIYDSANGDTVTRKVYSQRRGVSTPFTCLKTYQQNTPEMESASGLCNSISGGNKSAAQIINDVSKACEINPQVLLVLLQKEQSLITDDWPWPVQYQKATGFSCPDTAPCDPAYAGFFYQVYYAARQFKVYAKYPDNYNYKAGRNNYIYYNPNLSACGGSTVFIQNQSTASLYIYTPYQPNSAALNNLYGTGNSCSAYGNRNFWRMFNDWFGPPTHSLATDCNSKLADVACVWSVRKADGSQFLTTSNEELKKAVYDYGWTNEGVVFYAYKSNTAGTKSVHRLRKGGQHYFTSNESEYAALMNSGQWVDEGVRFYSLAASSTNSSYSVYKLYDASNSRYYWLRDSAKKTDLLNQGYTQLENSWNAPTALLELPPAPLGRDNIYQLKSLKTYLYTTNLAEVENAILKYKYSYEGVLSYASEDNTGIPVYRLQRGGKFLYTTSSQERDDAINTFGYSFDGVRFYVDGKTHQIYRIYNTIKGNYAYTTTMKTVMSMVNTNGWIYNGTLVKRPSAVQPVFRFINVNNHKHFYTLDTNEAFTITNREWEYEGVAFYASPDSGKPVYRLYGKGEHFYTTSATERDVAVNKYGYDYEGIRFYANSTDSGKPVYRLYGKGEHFYTTSATERDVAVNKYGYDYEGIRFYLP